MIVLDIETSGIYPEKHGIWQIGALDFYNPKNTFLEEARIDDEDEIQKDALKVHGKSEHYLRDVNKQSEKQLLENFFRWCENVQIKNILSHNPQFDRVFIEFKARKYNLKIISQHKGIDKNSPFHQRAFDLHSIAQLRYYQIYRKFLLREIHSDMGMSNILKFCGIIYERGSHNALEDAKLTAECFSRLVYGRNLLPDYLQFSIQKELIK